MNEDLKRNITLMVGLVVFAVFIFFCGLRVYSRWTEDHYFGKVIELVQYGFVIDSGDAGQRNVLIKPETIIEKGNKNLKYNLRIGDNVIIVGPLNNGVVEAKFIRIVDPRPSYSR